MARRWRSCSAGDPVRMIWHAQCCRAEHTFVHDPPAGSVLALAAAGPHPVLPARPAAPRRSSAIGRGSGSRLIHQHLIRVIPSCCCCCRCCECHPCQLRPPVLPPLLLPARPLLPLRLLLLICLPEVTNDCCRPAAWPGRRCIRCLAAPAACAGAERQRTAARRRVGARCSAGSRQQGGQRAAPRIRAAERRAADRRAAPTPGPELDAPAHSPLEPLLCRLAGRRARSSRAGGPGLPHRLRSSREAAAQGQEPGAQRCSQRPQQVAAAAPRPPPQHLPPPPTCISPPPPTCISPPPSRSPAPAMPPPTVIGSSRV